MDDRRGAGAHLSWVNVDLLARQSILVVDADSDTRALYRQSFQSSGYDVAEASDGRDALAKALRHPPAVIVTEITLPFIDGCALCEILRRDRSTAGVPILIVTAETRVGEIDRVRRMGADAVLVKPTTPDQMLTETRRLIAGANGRAGRVGPIASTAAQRGPSAQQPTRLSRSFVRFTTTAPPAAAPALTCPSCDRPLAYVDSYVGGVNAQHPEQWDRYRCPGVCGTFQYRHRTRKLRRIE